MRVVTTTEVILTGTGVPHVAPGRAGAGVLVRHGRIALQFDAGRATTLRLAEAGCAPHELSAIFITHVHSDHVADLADLVMTRWIESTLHPSTPLPIIAVEGASTRFCERMLDPYRDDIDLRIEHVQERPPDFDLRPIDLPMEPVEVWRSDDGTVAVDAVAVHHEPVAEAVAYRVRAGERVVVISGDTRVCDEVRDLAAGADLLVHEACRTTAMHTRITGTAFEHIFDYHADSVALGGLADAAGIGHLVLTHLIPVPKTPEAEQGFIDDVRSSGWHGPLTVGRDLMRFELD